MPQVLPITPSLPSSRVGTVLDGVPFILEIYWNGREEAWYMHVFDGEGEIIRHGIKIVLGAFLGRRTADPRYPAGFLVAADLSGEGRDAGFDDLGTPANGGRVVVYFYTYDEFAEVTA